LRFFSLLTITGLLWISSCKQEAISLKPEGASALLADSAETECIVLSFSVNPFAYRWSNFGEAPQIAVWLVNTDSSFYKTIWVSHRAGLNKWLGKVECREALPVWDKHRAGSREKPDAVSGATVKSGSFSTIIQVLPGKKYLCYCEVNASGDYNTEFASWSKAGKPDYDGNGQPSLIYKGSVDLPAGRVENPKLIGRTDQFRTDGVIHADTSGITTAKDLISGLQMQICEK